MVQSGEPNQRVPCLSPPHPAFSFTLCGCASTSTRTTLAVPLYARIAKANDSVSLTSETWPHFLVPSFLRIVPEISVRVPDLADRDAGFDIHGSAGERIARRPARTQARSPLPLHVTVKPLSIFALQPRPQQAIKNRERSILEIAIDDLEEVSRVRRRAKTSSRLIFSPHAISVVSSLAVTIILPSPIRRLRRRLCATRSATSSSLRRLQITFWRASTPSGR